MFTHSDPHNNQQTHMILSRSDTQSRKPNYVVVDSKGRSNSKYETSTDGVLEPDQILKKNNSTDAINKPIDRVLKS